MNLYGLKDSGGNGLISLDKLYLKVDGYNHEYIRAFSQYMELYLSFMWKIWY